MKWLNLATLCLLMLGGLNLGAMAVMGHAGDFLSNTFGGAGAGGARVVYGLVGLSALWQLMPFFNAWRIGEVEAEADHHSHA